MNYELFDESANFVLIHELKILVKIMVSQIEQNQLFETPIWEFDPDLALT